MSRQEKRWTGRVFFGIDFFNKLSLLTIQSILVLSVYQDIICFLLFPKSTFPTGPILRVQRRKKKQHSQSCSKQGVQKYSLFSLHTTRLKRRTIDSQRSCRGEKDSFSCALMIGQGVICFNSTEKTPGWLSEETFFWCDSFHARKSRPKICETSTTGGSRKQLRQEWFKRPWEQLILP